MQPRLDLRLSQKLVMTPQLQQAIKLLQLSRLELQDALTQQLEENPMLEEAGAELDEADTEIAANDETPAVAKTDDVAPSAEAPSEERDEPTLWRYGGPAYRARRDALHRSNDEAGRVAGGTSALAARALSLRQSRTGSGASHHRQPRRGRIPQNASRRSRGDDRCVYGAESRGLEGNSGVRPCRRRCARSQGMPPAPGRAIGVDRISR